MKKSLKSIITIVLVVTLLLGSAPIGGLGLISRAITFSQLNDAGVFLKQAGSSTCTLASATMMMRRYSMLRGDSNWNSITEASARTVAWVSGQGLKWDFTYSTNVKSISVKTYSLSNLSAQAKEDKIQYELTRCPEGIVIYRHVSNSEQHAVLLTDYTNGIYYCADPAGGSPSGRIPLSQAHLVNSISKITQIWKVTSPVVNGPTSDNQSFGGAISGIVQSVINAVSSANSAAPGYTYYTTSSRGVDFIKQFEGFRSAAYIDPAGVWTIGYGHTGGVYSGMVISEAQATQYLKNDLATAENAVNAFLKKHNRYVTQSQFDALVSFTFNVGTGWTYNSSYNIYKYMSTGAHTEQQVKDTFGSWVNAGGKRLPGLVTRRAKEAALYLYGTYDGTGGTLQNANNSNVTPGSQGGSSGSYSPGYYVVTAKSGLNVRSGPGTNYGRVSGFSKGTTVTVTSVSGSWGKCSAGWICLDYAAWTGALEPVINVPGAPSLNLTSAVDMPIGTAVTVTWNAASDADCYDIYLKKSNGTVDQSSIGNTGRNAAFTINTAGTYTVTAVSRNSKYTSAQSNTITVRAHNPSLVVFKDWNGNTISSQSVPYGRSATTPSNPSRYGWTFKRWDGSYTNVTSDKVVNAYYERNVYTVSFLDETGALIGNKQKVEFESAATAPSYTAPEGYSFLGWDQKFDYIESNMTINPVIRWTNDDLPVTVLSTTTAIREKTGYTVNVSVRNNPNKETDGRVIVALKTEEGKLLSSTESAAFHLKTSANKTIEVFMPYDRAATIAEIYVVEKFSTAIPISAILSKTIEQGTDWTNWSTTPNPEDAHQGESRTEYRYRTKSTTTSSNSSLAGWTKYDTKSAWSAYGSWSSWSDTSVTASDSRQVETRQVQTGGGYTEYRYGRLYSSAARHSTFCVHAQKSGYSYVTQYTDWSRTQAQWVDADGEGDWADWKCSVHGYYATYRPIAGSSSPYYWEESRYIQPTYKTQYRYRDRTLNYTYYYYQWSDWSAWSTTATTATDTKQVETRTTYRYIANNPALVADTTGTQRTITGTVAASLAGKQATLFIYKVDEASDFTNEFVGQTQIGTDGSYSFTFKLREEPSIKTGDFTVTLGIEGTSTAIVLDPIEAPKPQYTVTYLDWDGTVLSTQAVTEGQNAIPPQTNPSRTGYDFICWNNTATNVKDDMTVSPVYKIRTYTVVFVDWTEESVVMQTYEHGQPLVAPELEASNDSYSVGWDAVISGTKTVTKNMVITAKYEKKTYTVNFYDENGDVLETETVEHGEAAQVPASLVNNNVELIEWVPDGDIDSVVESIAVVPVFRFKETTYTPSASIESGEYTSAQTVTLSCATEDAVIYYTLNGDDPRETGIEYTAPFTINQSSELRFYACSIEKNDSETVRELIAINDGTATAKHVVTFISSSEINDFDSFFVDDGSTIGYTASSFIKDGYDFDGAYYGDESINSWDLANDIVTESMSIYLLWTPKMFTVTFVGYEDEVLDIQSVAYLDNAIPPEVPELEGLVFTGFDKDTFTITGDTVFTANYLPEDEYVAVKLNRTKYRLINGTSATLTARLEQTGNDPKTILWCSEDENVVIVNDDGVITAVGAGQAYIYAMCKESGSVAKCLVTVEPNSDEVIVIKSGKNIGFDTAGQLRGISAAKSENSVAQAKELFENDSLVFVSASGRTLTDTDLIGTGTVIKLVNGDVVLDEVTVVVTGDATGDGLINNRDAAMVTRYLVDKEYPSTAQLTAMDANGDGRVNNRDASMLSRYLVGKEQIA